MTSPLVGATCPLAPGLVPGGTWVGTCVLGAAFWGSGYARKLFSEDGERATIAMRY